MNVINVNGGQRQAVALTRARLWERTLILLDEQTAALGVQETRKAMASVRTSQSAGASIVLITHNMRMALEMSDRVVVLRGGRNVGDVPTASDIADAKFVSLITGTGDSWIEPREQKDLPTGHGARL